MIKKKEVYEMGFEQAKKKYYMSVNKSHLTTILELATPEKMFEAFNKKYSATNSTCFCQLFCNCQVISTQKNVVVLRKYEALISI